MSNLILYGRVQYLNIFDLRSRLTISPAEANMDLSKEVSDEGPGEKQLW